MNPLIKELARVAAQRTGVNLMAQDPKFVAALAELIVGRCADIADEQDVYQTYNIAAEILDTFGLTTE
jgi:hypothetical protein